MIRRFTTPAGNAVSLECRDGSSDEDICRSVIERDEYGLAAVTDTFPPGMFIFDIGAHIGSFAIMAVRDLCARVVAVEPVTENSRQLWRNVELNDMADRVLLVRRPAGVGPVSVGYGYEGRNTFVGNLGEGEPAAVEEGVGVTLSNLLGEMDYRTGIETLPLLKIDCERCEWVFLQDPAISRVERIVGEFHGSYRELIRLLLPTHHLARKGFTFTAVRR